MPTKYRQQCGNNAAKVIMTANRQQLIIHQRVLSSWLSLQTSGADTKAGLRVCYASKGLTTPRRAPGSVNTTTQELTAWSSPRRPATAAQVHPCHAREVSWRVAATDPEREQATDARSAQRPQSRAQPQYPTARAPPCAPSR
eukprot:6205595-Pleurochrysis_carterae.AAC.3